VGEGGGKRGEASVFFSRGEHGQNRAPLRKALTSCAKRAFLLLISSNSEEVAGHAWGGKEGKKGSLEGGVTFSPIISLWGGGGRTIRTFLLEERKSTF